MDEDILQSGVNLAPIIRLDAKRCDGLLQGGGIVSAHMQHAAERNGLADAGTFAKLLSECMQILSAHRPRRETRLMDHIGDRPKRQQLPACDEGQPMTAFRFVHVMSSNEKG